MRELHPSYCELSRTSFLHACMPARCGMDLPRGQRIGSTSCMGLNTHRASSSSRQFFPLSAMKSQKLGATLDRSERVTIPSHIRRRLRLVPSDRVFIALNDQGTITLQSQSQSRSSDPLSKDAAESFIRGTRRG